MRTILLPGLLALLITACGGGASDAPATDAPTQLPAPEMGARIRTMEDTLFAKTVFDRRGAQALLDVYKAYAKAFPTDSMAPEYLFRAAGMSKGLGQPQDAVLLYDRIIKEYPKWGRLADTYYLRAFTIDADLKEKGRAKTAYEEVINRFPDHRFAQDARAMIQNLQYTDEELIERFRRMNDSIDAAAGKAS
ncbi:MAG TPA: tetratricopeptide repeat protein [Flavobacteriales bacterium]|nr:tetratricopeptide repeat protein [Flavobacteriales bacterium]HMR26111.1 tetratricopeptide repeat protein [Flavobacteriales bacterium]